MEWAADSRTVLYTRIDDKLRPDRLYACDFSEGGEEKLLFQEHDGDILVDISKTKVLLAPAHLTMRAGRALFADQLQLQGQLRGAQPMRAF
jgi:protease II